MHSEYLTFCTDCDYLVQIGLVSAHFFKVFFESYWLLGYSVIRSEPPKKFKPQGFQFFYEREINLRCKLFSEKYVHDN